MKTLKELSSGKIVRVSDEKAEQLVKEGTHSFVPKKEWKETR
jgi:hypothetical protein